MSMRSRLKTSGIPELAQYTSYAEFIRDTTVTPDQLITIIGRNIYIKGLARAIAKHPSCTIPVFKAMRKRREWFMQAVGYLHYRLPVNERMVNAMSLLTASHGALRRASLNTLKDLEAKGGSQP
jgi:hypothetical protein